mgnify:CR=1 FL=1
MSEKLNDIFSSLEINKTMSKIAIQKIFAIAIPKLKKLFIDLKDNSDSQDIPQLVSGEQQILDQILYNVKLNKKWSTEIAFNDLKSRKTITKIFVDLDFYLTPLRQNIVDAKVSIYDMLGKKIKSFLYHLSWREESDYYLPQEYRTPPAMPVWKEDFFTDFSNRKNGLFLFRVDNGYALAKKKINLSYQLFYFLCRIVFCSCM